MARQIVGEIFLNVKPLDAGVASGVQTIIDKASSQAAKVPVSADTTQAEEAVGRLSGQIEEGLGGAWATAAIQAAGFTAAVVGIQRTVEGVVGKLAGVFDQLAQAQAGFSAILGSESAGGRLLDEIREFARVSPFVTQELVTYSQQLLGVGQSAASIVPLLRNTGDLIASVGGDTQNISRVLFTLTQIRSIGRLVGQDAIQLQSALVPITKLLADYLDLTTAQVKKLQEQGSISADTVFAAISNAGQKVEGAMDKATRNIGGAQAVLSDTIKIMLQESSFLQAVFEDIFNGILTFSNALGEPAIANNLEAINESLSRLYIKLQPLLEGFGGAGATAAVNGLRILASTLEILANAIDSVPDVALKAIGQALTALLILKAPLALLSYASSLTKLIAPLNILGAGAGGGMIARFSRRLDQSRISAQQASVGIGKYQVGITKVGLAFGAAAVLAGQYLSNMEAANKETEKAANLQLAAGALQGAGVGVALGAAFGPVGAFVGALGGGAAGAITSFVTGMREEAKKRSEEIIKIGEDAADDFLNGFKIANPLGFENGAGFRNFFEGLEESFGNIGEQQKELETLQNSLNEFTKQRDGLTNVFGPTLAARGDLGGLQLDNAEAQIDRLTPKVKELEEELGKNSAAVNKRLTDGESGEALAELQDKMAAVSNALPELKTNLAESIAIDGGSIEEGIRVILQATGQLAIETPEDFAKVSAAFVGAGVSIDQFINLPYDLLVSMLGTEFPDALRASNAELLATKTAFDEAKKGVEAYFAGYNLDLDQAAASVSQSKELFKSAFDFTESGGQEGGSKFGTDLLTTVKSIATATEIAFQGVEGIDAKALGTTDSLSFAAAQFDIIREKIGGTDAEFQNLLDSAGLLQLYLDSESFEGAFGGTLKGLSARTGFEEERLRAMLNLSDKVSSDSELIASKGAVDLLSQIDFLEEKARTMPSLENSLQLTEAKTRLNEMVGLAGGLRTEFEESVEPVSAIAAAMEGYATAVASAQRDLTEGGKLGDLFEQIQVDKTGSAEFANQILETVNTISQGSLAVFGDETRALNAGYSFVTATLGSLQTELGLTDEKFLDLVDTMGLLQLYNDAMGVGSGFAGSIDELITSTGIANTDLRELLGLAEALAGETEIVVTADTTRALAKITDLREELIALDGYGNEAAVGRRIGEEARTLAASNAAGAGVRVIESTVYQDFLDKQEADRIKAQEEARREAERVQRELEQYQREQERLREQALREAEQAQREAERLAEEQKRLQEEFLREQERIYQSNKQATETVAKAIESAAQNIEAAAESWVASIKERTQAEKAVPIERLLRNAGQQRDDLGFLNTALETLKSRGLSDTALKALEIDNVTDIRQVKRLLGASSGQLQELSNLVGLRDANAEAIAKRQQAQETQATIVAAIVQAAGILGVEITPERAAAISANFTINGDSTGTDLPPDLLAALTSVGRIVRS